ncbi:peptidoglycan DD-metalloendopeptidase family protein [Eubacteriales bacterium OttesenSCG-928-G02]|nr:peptidoglycan DD-metalloendopeptidase family protein [Eubacteriales bacterium OttesenSCG-928-G02]
MKKKISIILFICICFTSLVTFRMPNNASAAPSSTTIQDDRNALAQKENERNAAKQQLDRLKKQMEEAKGEYNQLFAEKILVEGTILYLATEIELTESLITDYEAFIKKLNDDYIDKEAQLEEYYEIYDKVLCYYYEYGNISSLELLLESKNISDFLTRLDYLSFILEYNNTITKKIEDAQLALEDTIAEQVTANENLQANKAALEEKKNEAASEQIKLESIIKDIDKNIKNTQDQLNYYNSLQNQLLNEINEINKQIEQKLTYVEGSYGWPIGSVDVMRSTTTLTSWYGNRKDPFTGTTAYHNGMDIAALAGTPILAVKSGIVVRSELSTSGFGEVITINHEDGTSTLYGHCSKRLVKVNQRVIQGQVIGLVGTTGRSTGNHLHFSVIVNGSYVDPYDYLPKSFNDAINKQNKPRPK